jgi:hypothetical protein
MNARDHYPGVKGMQTERPVYEEIEELLEAIGPPPVALVEQRADSPRALRDIRAAVG